MRHLVLLLVLPLLPLFADDPPPGGSSDPRIDEAVRKGVAYLISKQDAGGSWKNDGTNSCPAEGYSVAGSAIACLALLESRDVVHDAGAARALREGIDWLVAWGLQAGGRTEKDREA